MRVLVVFAHPLTESFSGTLAATVRRTLESAGHETVFTDLYREHFDPVLTDTERASQYRGAGDSSGVASYVDELRRAEGIVFVFPHWWFNVPAILKGYFDRVWTPGVAFRHASDRGRTEPLLTNLRKVWVVTTYSSSRWMVSVVMRNPTRRLFRIGLLRRCARRVRFCMLAHYDMDRATQRTRMLFLDRVERKLKRF
jgi:NAD(P)H dehydrogenase (quinone)